MGNKSKTLVLALIATVWFTGLLHAEERDRNVEVRGVFVTRAERQLGEREYLALVIKPFERDDHVTVLVPRNEDFMHAARQLREGDKVEIGCVVEEGQKWLKRIKIERSAEKPRPSEEEAHRRELGRHQKVLQNQARDIKREMKGLRDDQDAEARQLQALLNEINQELRNIERELKGPESQERRIERKEIRIKLEREGEHPEMAAKMEILHAQIAELKEAAMQAEREGRHDKAAQLHQEAKMLADKLAANAGEVREIEAQRLKQQIIQLKEMAGEAKQQGQMEKAKELWAHAEELEQVLKREFGQPKMKKPRPEGLPEKLPPKGHPPIHQPPIAPPPHQPPLPHQPPNIEEQIHNLKVQLKDALEHRLQQAGKQLKEALAERFLHVKEGFHELSMHIERLEKELNELRAENEQLRRELRERMQTRREQDRQIRERIRPEAQRRPSPEERERPLRSELDQRRRGDRPEREKVEQRDRVRAEREGAEKREGDRAERERDSRPRERERVEPEESRKEK